MTLNDCYIIPNANFQKTIHNMKNNQKSTKYNYT